MWDTREPAQNILRSVLEAHGDKLAELPQKLEDGKGTLYDLCSLGENSSDVRFCCLPTTAHAFTQSERKLSHECVPPAAITCHVDMRCSAGTIL